MVDKDNIHLIPRLDKAGIHLVLLVALVVLSIMDPKEGMVVVGGDIRLECEWGDVCVKKGRIFLAIQYLLDIVMTMNGFYYDKRKIHILLPISRLVAYHHYHSNIFFLPTQLRTHGFSFFFFQPSFLFLYILFYLALLTYAYGRTICRATSYLDTILFLLNFYLIIAIGYDENRVQ